MSFEVNFDGLVGPTHNYAGLSPGNVASMKHRGLVASPREAALQGLAKMRHLHGLGLHQAFFPPLERPSLSMLRHFGFGGDIPQMLRSAREEAPALLRVACSSSSMWTANAATVAPSTDTRDGRFHFTPANLVTNLHRAMESSETAALLRRVFHDDRLFSHHAPLAGGPHLGDEGAANHTRLASSHSSPGLHFFVYGFQAMQSGPRPERFPARQSLEASACVARLNQLDPAHCFFAQQNPAAIDAGVFHNDVIATGNENFLLYHESAYLDADRTIEDLQTKYRDLFQQDLILAKVPLDLVSLADAIRSYLFNSQIVTTSPGRMVIIAPEECRETAAVRTYLDDLVGDPANPVQEAFYFDLRASMANGGGPACLRLRVVLDEEAWAAVPNGIKIDEPKLRQLEDWVTRHYRESLTEAELADPSLVEETRVALDELTAMIDLPNLYSFQR